jgi:polyisoprenyl-phosphate glycosyltransferase
MGPVRGLRSWVGFRQAGLAYEREARAAGEVKYTFPKLLKLALDGILSFSVMPLRMTTYMGLIASGLSLALAIFMLVQRFFSEWFLQFGLPYVPGFAASIVSSLFFGGVQLVMLGILGEYLGRIYDQVRGRPLWTVQDMRGFESGSHTVESRRPE